jgi:chemotaxis regulatin CheY-phosphate phosphatase CheZ
MLDARELRLKWAVEDVNTAMNKVLETVEKLEPTPENMRLIQSLTDYTDKLCHYMKVWEENNELA